MFGAWLSTLSEAAVVTAANASTSTGLTSLTLVNKGLLTTLLGLLGVFLVLLLFFVAIKLMQGIGTKKVTGKE